MNNSKAPHGAFVFDSFQLRRRCTHTKENIFLSPKNCFQKSFPLCKNALPDAVEGCNSLWKKFPLTGALRARPNVNFVKKNGIVVFKCLNTGVNDSSPLANNFFANETVGVLNFVEDCQVHSALNGCFTGT